MSYRLKGAPELCESIHLRWFL